jgi:glycosyltransferase involved in cell wall biosynthesis
MMSNKPIISIIIPVYNTSPYIVRCLDSIFKQSLNDNIEVIVMEAGSTDNSLAVLEEYKILQNSFQIIKHEKRVPLSTSRKVGMNAANGEYIMHLDSDDWLLDNCLQLLIDELKIFPDVDIHVFNYNVTDAFKKTVEFALIKDELIVNNKISVKKYFLSTVWNKVIKRALTQDLIYDQRPVTIEEDLIYSVEIFFKAKKIRLSRSSFYSYYFNNSSLTKTIESIHYLEMRVQQLEVINELFTKYNPQNSLRKFVLNYFEKGIYIELSRIYLYNKMNIGNKDLFIKKLDKVGLLNINSLKRITKSLHNKYYCFWSFFLFSGYKHFFGLIFRRIKYRKL